MKKSKSLAIVGIGRWGKNLLREFNKVARVEFCYHKGNPETKKWLAANYPRIKIANSYRELLANPAIDAVVIATPIKTHYALTRQALLAGKDVFVEKPITDNVKHAQELIKLARNKKRILFVGHIFLYHPVLAKIKSIARHEPIKHAVFVWDRFGPFNEELIFNLASHDVALALELFGQPTGIKTFENRGMVTDSDIFYARLGFKNHRACTIFINRVSNLKNKTVTFATAKNVYLWENERLLKLGKKADNFKLIYKSAKTPLEVECAEFVKCLAQNKKPLTDGNFGLEVVKLLYKFRQS